jgi:competence protein ComGC
MRSRKRPSRCGAFTLVELLVVVGIIALLVTILMPSLARAKELARRAVCATNLNVLGKGWYMYWQDYNYRTPHMFNPLRQVTDCYSQFNFVIWICNAAYVDGRWEGTVARPDYVNAGKLYQTRNLGGEQAYVCPTVAANSRGPWFNDENPWPVNNRRHTLMTYGTRRMQNYDDPSLANQINHYDTRDDHIMIWSTGVESIPDPSGFSFMADSFRMPSAALKSHVPGVQVMYLDTHVEFYEDTTGEVLYDNGLPYDHWDPVWNWQHDDIWMIIDGYHRPPVGQ